VILLGVLAAIGQGPRAEEKAATEALPPDLARVPVKAFALLSIRAADVWTSPLGKSLRGKLGKVIEAPVKEAQGKTGLSPADLERVTLVLMDHRARRPLIFFATTKALDPKKVFALFVPEGNEEKYAGEKIVANERGEAAFVLGEKAFVVGSKADVQSMLDGGKADRGIDLGPALAQAAGKHSAVVGLSGAGLRRLEADAPAGEEQFRALLRATAATLVLDVGPKTKGRLGIRFASDEEAKKGAEALTFVKGFFEKALAGSIKQLGEDSKAARLVKLAATAKGTLESAEVKRDGARLTAALEAKVDEATTGAAAVELAMRMRKGASRAQSTNNLRQIAIAMYNYQDTNKAFPPQAIYDKNGKALLSWRVLILPYLDQDALYKEFKLDEPWDSPQNKKLLAKMPRTYQMGAPKEKFGTFYQGFVGPKAFFEGKRGIGVGDIKDGTSNTIMIVEAGKDVPWTKPEDLPFDAGKPLPKLGGAFPGQGFTAAFCDGSVRFFSANAKEATLKKYITRNGGEAIKDDD
jgi:hypothetical protein